MAKSKFKARALPALKKLRKLFVYDPSTGVLCWRESGEEAGCVSSKGYRVVYLNKQHWYVHRLIWYIYWGEDPRAFIVDHIDGNPLNNIIDNLRLATKAQNTHNSRVFGASGLKGAYLESTGKYSSCITIKGKCTYLGYFDTAEEAHAAYMQKAQELFGSYACSPERARAA